EAGGPRALEAGRLGPIGDDERDVRRVAGRARRLDERHHVGAAPGDEDGDTFFHAAPAPQTPSGFPSPLWGGVRGGGSHDIQCSAIPPSLSLPHKGGGKRFAASVIRRTPACPNSARLRLRLCLWLAI